MYTKSTNPTDARADPRAADHLEPLGAVDQAGVELRRRADDDRVVVAEPLGQVEVAVLVHVEARAQQLDAARSDRLTDENAQTVAHTRLCSNVSSAPAGPAPRSMSAPASASASSRAARPVTTSKMST
jgi:hypothetical protein